MMGLRRWRVRENFDYNDYVLCHGHRYALTFATHLMCRVLSTFILVPPCPLCLFSLLPPLYILAHSVYLSPFLLLIVSLMHVYLRYDHCFLYACLSLVWSLVNSYVSQSTSFVVPCLINVSFHLAHSQTRFPSQLNSACNTLGMISVMEYDQRLLMWYFSQSDGYGWFHWMLSCSPLKKWLEWAWAKSCEIESHQKIPVR